MITSEISFPGVVSPRLVEFAPVVKTFDPFMGPAIFLEDLLEHRVELLTPESLSPFIGPHSRQAAQDVLLPA
jgi:uncharacterized protein